MFTKEEKREIKKSMSYNYNSLIAKIKRGTPVYKIQGYWSSNGSCYHTEYTSLKEKALLLKSAEIPFDDNTNLFIAVSLIRKVDEIDTPQNKNYEKLIDEYIKKRKEELYPYGVEIKKGYKIWFEEEKRPYKVRATDGRFAVCTKPYNFKPKTVIYTIVDFKEKIRGTDNLVFSNYGYYTDKSCKECLKDLTTKVFPENSLSDTETEISSRNRIDLNIKRISKK